MVPHQLRLLGLRLDHQIYGEQSYPRISGNCLSIGRNRLWLVGPTQSLAMIRFGIMIIIGQKAQLTMMKMHTPMVQLSMIPIQILREQLLTSMPLVLILMRPINRPLLYLTWDLLRLGQD